MFKKTRKKIVVAIMMILVLLWVGTLGLIYTSSYFDMVRHNKEILKDKTEKYELSQSLENEEPQIESESDQGPPEFLLSTFYMVAVSYDGDILKIENESPTVYSDEDLTEMAHQIIEENKTYGVDSELAFYKTDKGGYILVAFKDNTVMNEGTRILLHYTLIFGIVMLVLFFFLSVYFARKIVAPLEESYQKQKQFISDAGHELKTPVAVVSANAELLSREVGDNQWLQNI